MKKVIVCMLVAVMLLMVPMGVRAEEIFEGNNIRIQVEMSKYPLFINGQLIESENSLYPLLSYKDMLYFPMTWNYSRVLGVAAEWSLEEGLRLNVENVTSQIPDYGFASNIDEEFYAVMPDYSITINGVKEENKDLEYPIFNFRDITYFPMTDEMKQKLEWYSYLDPLRGFFISKQGQQEMVVNNLFNNVVSIFENTQVNFGQSECNERDVFIGVNSYMMEHQMCEDCMNCIQTHVMKLVQEYHLVPRVVDFTIELRMFGGDVPMCNQTVKNDTDIIVYVE